MIRLNLVIAIFFSAHHRNDNPDLIASTQLPYNSRHHHHHQHHQVYLHQQQLPYDQTNQIQPTHEASACMSDSNIGTQTVGDCCPYLPFHKQVDKEYLKEKASNDGNIGMMKNVKID